MTYDLIPEDLKTIRKTEAQLEPKEFAEALGYSYDLIKSWESGRAIPSYEAQIRICELAGIEFKIRPEKKHPLLLKKAKC